MSSIVPDDHFNELLASGTAHEVEEYLERHEASCPPSFVSEPQYRAYLRKASVAAVAAENLAVVRYLCEEKGVPVNHVPLDEFAWTPNAQKVTPLAEALLAGGEEMALYLLSLPRDEESPPLNLDTRMSDEHDSMPLLTVAVITGMVRVVEAIIGLGADLRARDARGHLAVCDAVTDSHVNVVNVLLEAHAKFFLGVGMVLECPAGKCMAKKEMFRFSSTHSRRQDRRYTRGSIGHGAMLS